MNQNEYVRKSLELHLFFGRIMKEHSLFLEMAFMEKNKKLREIAQEFGVAFSNLLETVIPLAEGKISEEFLLSGEMITPNTLGAENQTKSLAGTFIDTNITIKEGNLKSGMNCGGESLVEKISNINRETLPLIQNLIEFKRDILKSVLDLKLFTFNYPLLIAHIMSEAQMYHDLLTKLENGVTFDQEEMVKQELFWNNIMKEHALFIRGLLDPIENELILTADEYARKYENLLKSFEQVPDEFTSESLKQTIEFKKFKIAGEEGILTGKIKSVIIPLLADHVLREANHFIRLLKSGI